MNGVAVGSISFPPTNDWEDWQTTDIFEAPCEAGATNTLRITASTGSGGPNVDSLTVVTQSVQGTPEPTTSLSSAPVTSAPITSAPVTSAPITSAPVTSAPITSAPVTSAPVTSAPITSAPTTDGPSSASPTTNKPTPIPTFSSTAGEYVKSIFEAGSIATEVGCQLSNGRLLLATIIIICNMVLCLTLYIFFSLSLTN